MLSVLISRKLLIKYRLLHCSPKNLQTRHCWKVIQMDGIFLDRQKTARLHQWREVYAKGCIVWSPSGIRAGPLIFFVLLGDIDTGTVNASVSSFADDIPILAKISSPQSVGSMQQDLETIYQWSETNNMQFNANKFECMRYGTNEQIKASTSYFSNSGSIIETKDSVTDLGIVMSSSAYFGEHISKVGVSAGL